MKKNLTIIVSALFLTTLLMGWVIAGDQGKMPGKVVTISGQVIDPACYLKQGKHGLDHKMCAQTCAKAGQSLAILEDKTGKIYVSLGAEMGDDPNAKIFNLAEEKVKVSGTVITKGGINGIVISKAELASTAK